MNNLFNFDSNVIHSVVGGRSVIDIPRLNLKTLDEVDLFLKSYGFDVEKKHDLDQLWFCHRRSIVLMTEKLGFQLENIPDILRDRKSLQDIRLLLLFASNRVNESEDKKNLQKWSCALLRCIHVFVHTEHDLFSYFSKEIQNQILAPFQKAIYTDGNNQSTYLKNDSLKFDPIEIVKFEMKPFKTSSSTVIKLLAKPDAIAMRVFDKLGVRFITKSIFDSFQVIRFLVQSHIISFPHIMPDQSSNTLYPTSLFLEIAQELFEMKAGFSDINLNHLFETRLADKSTSELDFLRKENLFSGEDYRFIKFISRKLIQIQRAEENERFSFFFPFEVQIIDQASFAKTLSGPLEHQAYKERQIEAARQRLFPN